MPTKKSIITGGVLIIIAIVCATIAITIVVPGVTLLPGFRRTAADIAPASSTVLLLHHPTPSDIARWGEVFPALLAMTPKQGMTDIGILRNEAGEEGWMTFQKRTEGKVDSEDLIIGPFLVRLSDERWKNTFHDGQRLMEDPAFRALGSKAASRWTYVRREALPPSLHLEGRIAETALLGSSQKILQWTESASSVLTLSPRRTRVHPIEESEALPSILQHPEVIIRYGGGRDGVRAWMDTLRRDDRMVADGMLLTGITAITGSEISVQRTLLPLLASDTTIEIGRSASGSLEIFLAGRAQDTIEASDHLADLHTSFRLRHPDVEILEHQFDKRFTLQTAQIAENRILTEERSIEGWTIVTTTDPEDGRSLTTGVQGRNIIISNTPGAILAYAAGASPTTFPMPHTTRPLSIQTIALGIIPGTYLDASPALKLLIQTSPQTALTLEHSNNYETLRAIPLIIPSVKQDGGTARHGG